MTPRFLFVLLYGCGAGMTPTIDPKKEACDTQAIAAAVVEGRRLCSLDVAWDDCPEARRIETELQTALEDCRKQRPAPPPGTPEPPP